MIRSVAPEQLEQEVASLQRRLDRSLAENERLEQEIARVQKLLEEAVRKRKRNTSSVLPRQSQNKSQNSGTQTGGSIRSAGHAWDTAAGG